MSPMARKLATTLAVAVLGTTTLWRGSDGFTAFTSETVRRQSVLTDPRPLPASGLEDQDGRRFALQDYAGKLLAVEFIYTQCNSICYSLGSSFRQIRDQLPAQALGKNIVLLSISFDPQHDDPARLREFGRRFGADGKHWRIARPTDESQLAPLLAAFGVVVIPDAMGGFEHNAAIHLVDRDGRLQRISDLDAVAPFVDTVTAQL